MCYCPECHSKNIGYTTKLGGKSRKCRACFCVFDKQGFLQHGSGYNFGIYEFEVSEFSINQFSVGLIYEIEHKRDMEDQSWMIQKQNVLTDAGSQSPEEACMNEDALAERLRPSI